MSTYSPSLRIELITTGDQAGTWGTTTNTNLGTLVESAIAGYIAVSITSANQALTALDGAPDQSRNQTIALTTTTTAPFNVYAPPAEKTYVIYNASAYVATIYNSTVLGNTTAAGTGVAIPAGKSMTVWSDGTNFAVQNSHIIGTIAGNVTGNLTGNVVGNVTGNINGVVTATAGSVAVTQSFGTNNTAIATTAFVQAALQALHPVGSIYTATVSTNPNTLFGFGGWTAFGAGRVLIGNGGGFSAGATGGSADAVVVSHNHGATSIVNDPQHSHIASAGLFLNDSFNAGTYAYGGFGSNISTVTNTASGGTGITVSTSVSTTGSSATNANLQPYIVVYMWQRTS